MRYRDQDTIDDIQRAADSGVPVPKIAERAHMEVRELCELMHWPQWQGGSFDAPIKKTVTRTQRLSLFSTKPGKGRSAQQRRKFINGFDNNQRQS